MHLPHYPHCQYARGNSEVDPSGDAIGGPTDPSISQHIPASLDIDTSRHHGEVHMVGTNQQHQRALLPASFSTGPCDICDQRPMTNAAHNGHWAYIRPYRSMLCRVEPFDVIEWTSLGLVAITGHLHRKTSLSQRRFKGILAMSGGFGGVHGARQ